MRSPAARAGALSLPRRPGPLRPAAFAWGALLTAAGAVGVHLSWARTPPLPGAASVATLEWLQLGGLRQSVLIRGRDRSRPVLLFLHGGPGMPSAFLAHAFQRPLEGDFVVVHWDRRGAGRSWTPSLRPDQLSVSALLSDAEELIRELRRRFGERPMVVLGHSWGSYLGTLLVQRRPELFRAYVGVGQVVDREAEWPVQERFLRREALRRGDAEALEDLRLRGRDAAEELLFRFGGALASATSWRPLLVAGLASPEYTLRDVLRVGRASSFSSRHMRYDVIDGPLAVAVERYPVPAFFFTGRRDYTSPWPLVVSFYERVDAPLKRLVWFERSAHFPFFEEPERFASEMRAVLAATGEPPAPPSATGAR